MNCRYEEADRLRILAKLRDIPHSWFCETPMFVDEGVVHAIVGGCSGRLVLLCVSSTGCTDMRKNALVDSVIAAGGLAAIVRGWQGAIKYLIQNGIVKGNRTDAL